MVRRKEREGEDSEEDEGGEGRRQWPGALALRAWPHSQYSQLSSCCLTFVTSDICPAGHT